MACSCQDVGTTGKQSTESVLLQTRANVMVEMADIRHALRPQCGSSFSRAFPPSQPLPPSAAADLRLYLTTPPVSLHTIRTGDLIAPT
jgi:hypothetical protein